MEERDFDMVLPNTTISDPYLPRINTVNLEPIQFSLPLVNNEEVHRRATLLQQSYSLDNNGFVEENLGLMSDRMDRETDIARFNIYLSMGLESLTTILSVQQQDREFILQFVWPGIVHTKNLTARQNIDITNLSSYCSTIATEQNNVINQLHTSFADIRKSISINSKHSIAVLAHLTALEDSIQKGVNHVINTHL